MGRSSDIPAPAAAIVALGENGAPADAFSVFGASQPLSASERVAYGVLQALERREMSPGQRLVETDLAASFGVGRNAVREAIQWLIARGVVDGARNRSPTIRTLGMDETIEVLEVAEMMTGLIARAAARNFEPARDGAMMGVVIADIATWETEHRDAQAFSGVRRNFFGALLHIGANRELKRLFASVHMNILYAQLQSAEYRRLRAIHYRAICEAVMSGDVIAAEAAGRAYVANVREVLLQSKASTAEGLRVDILAGR